MRRDSFINRGQRLSPSARRIIKLRQRAFANGGASLELQIPTNYIRDISRTLNYDILSDASLVMTPNTIGEGRLFNCQPVLRNLLKNSEEFDNASYVKFQTSITANATTAPDGNNTADKLIESATNDFHYITQGITAELNAVYTFTIYAKKAEVTTIAIESVFGGNRSLTVDLNTGTGTASALQYPYYITLDNNGFYKIVVSFINSGGSTTNRGCRVYLRQTSTTGQYLGDGTSGVYLWGAQLEKNSNATASSALSTAYQRTTDGIIDFQATRATTATVVQKDGSIGSSCYNQLQFSEDYTNAYWTKDTSTISTSIGLNPFGVSATLNKVIPNNAPGTNLTGVSRAFTPASTIINLSAYFKSAEYNFGVITINNSSNEMVYFDLNSGVISFNGVNALNAKIINVGNGWFRCSVSYSVSIVNNNFRFNASGDGNPTVPHLGDGTSGVYVWGSQITYASESKDYIKTTNRLAVPSIDYSLGSSLPALLVEPARSNIFLNSDVGVTQNITVTAQPYALSFYGTGSITLSGTFSGSLNGTGVNNRVSLIFTPTAGTLTLTVSGSITFVQLE